MAKKNNTTGKLQESLVLFKYMLSLFDCTDLAPLSQCLKDPSLEGLDDNGESKFVNALIPRFSAYISEDKLKEYDINIIRHTKEISTKRPDEIQWKYFQYLSLLFTEIYLDRYFSQKEQLLQDIQSFHEDKFNKRDDTWHGLPTFTDRDLNKLAYWCATGSGKTLLMHVNIKQYLYYADKYHAKPLNKVIILTPNEGLSGQHLRELELSNMDAELFSKSSGELFRKNTIEIIDINKLADKDGDKTVAVESFEGNNLVMVDEGHKGSGGDVWKRYRNTLTKDGFSFEYSATFGQAISAASSKTTREALLEEYGKATLFDYSYRYFYNDGYGKDYRILNMADWNDPDMFKMYLTAYILSLYEQTLAFSHDNKIAQVFNVEKPLGIFVGGSVNAVRKEGNRQVSDVVVILLFLQDFIKDKNTYSLFIKRLLDPTDGIKNNNGYSIFANSFPMTKEGMKAGMELEHAKSVYDRILKNIFNSNISGAFLHLVRLTSGDGEIVLQVGDGEPFGVINVGDSDTLAKLCQQNGMQVDTRQYGKVSFFDKINEKTSTINILIGSKKFSEGWNSWRVSVMGLMNVGRSEGSEIIQLFGRGVRLKGFAISLKRSSALEPFYRTGNHPKGIRGIETLNIFGVRADYMEVFRSYLEDEGLPGNDGTYEQIQIPTVNLLGNKRLKIVRLKEGVNFKEKETVHPLDSIAHVKVSLDWTPKVAALTSGNASISPGVATPTGYLSKDHLNFLDWNRIYFAIQQMKNERSWYNIEISINDLKSIMQNPSWYMLTIPAEALRFNDYGKDIARWEDITIALLRAYIDRAYKQLKGKWESKYMETVYLEPDDPNFFNEYSVEVSTDKNVWLTNLKILRDQIITGAFVSDFDIEAPWIQAIRFDQHLYYPLLCLTDKDSQGHKTLANVNTGEPLIKVSPVALNKGESLFIENIRDYYVKNKDGELEGKEVFLLRNVSRKGIGFFDVTNFYPDFILWVNEGLKQHVTFIDPKGIRNLRGLADPKIQLFKQLRNDVQPSLGDSDIILDSYIISNTAYTEVSFWGALIDFENNHVLFQTSPDYIDKMFRSILI